MHHSKMAGALEQRTKKKNRHFVFWQTELTAVNPFALFERRTVSPAYLSSATYFHYGNYELITIVTGFIISTNIIYP